MPSRQDQLIYFTGLGAPIALNAPKAWRGQFLETLKAWPHGAPPDHPAPPFATVTQRPDGRYDLHGAPPAALRTGDGVNTICDLIVEMVWQNLRQNPGLLCLHAAAVEIGGRLVVLPNARRAGKSTLAVALAQAGARLYSDDVLPVRIDATSGQAMGLAGGVAPRLRLPLPPCSDRFARWAGRAAGPANKRYKYLTDLPLAPMGTSAPLGAIVLLDRQDAPTPAQLLPAPLDEVLSRLVLQQFARHIHAADILRATADIVGSIPLYVLRYSDFEQAAALMVAAPELQDLPAARVPPALAWPRLANWQEGGAPRTAPPDACFHKPLGGADVTAGASVFAADAAGRGVRRLDGMSAVAWLVLEDGMTHADLAAALQDIYPDIDTARLADDCQTCLMQFLGWGLIAIGPAAHPIAADAAHERTRQ